MEKLTAYSSKNSRCSWQTAEPLNLINALVRYQLFNSSTLVSPRTFTRLKRKDNTLTPRNMWIVHVQINHLAISVSTRKFQFPLGTQPSWAKARCTQGRFQPISHISLVVILTYLVIVDLQTQYLFITLTISEISLTILPFWFTRSLNSLAILWRGLLNHYVESLSRYSDLLSHYFHQ